MENAVAVALETGSVLIGFFGNGSVSGANSVSRPRGENRRSTRFALNTRNGMGGDERRRGISVGEDEIVRCQCPVHRAHPLLLALCGVLESVV
jgi:hypothetical protein